MVKCLGKEPTTFMSKTSSTQESFMTTFSMGGDQSEKITVHSRPFMKVTLSKVKSMGKASMSTVQTIITTATGHLTRSRAREYTITLRACTTESGTKT